MGKVIAILLVIIIPLYSSGQVKNEKLKVFWPEEYKWKTIVNTNDSSRAFMQVIPESESPATWTIAGTLLTTKNLIAPNLDLIIQSYTNASLKESSKAMITVIERNDTAKNTWVLLKVETPSFPNDPIPESDFWYIQQGNNNHFAAFVAIREKEFSDLFIEKWTKIFKMSRLMYD